MKLLFMRHLKGYYEAWRERHAGSYSHGQLVEALVDKYKTELYEPNRAYIYRDWTSMKVSGWGRQKKNLGNGRQLMFVGEDFDDLRIRYKIPECLKLPESLGGMSTGKAKRKDWLHYLGSLDRHIQFAADQQQLMAHLFEHILDPIFREHPDIDTNAAIEIAVERGLLEEFRKEDSASAREGGA